MAGSLYFWEMLLPALGLCLPLNRREKSLWKAVACMITGVVLLMVIMKLAQTKYEGTLISMGENIMFSMMMLGWFLVIWSLVIGCIYFFVQCSLREAMYIFALSYGVEHIFYCIRLLTEWLTGGHIGNTAPLIYLPCMAGSFLLAYFWSDCGRVGTQYCGRRTELCAYSQYLCNSVLHFHVIKPEGTASS